MALWPAAGLGQVPGPTTAGGPDGARGPLMAQRVDAPVPAPSLELLRSPGGAFAASLVVPGAGQAALGLRRWLAYGALEVAFWAIHLDAAADVRRLSTAYRDLAWEAARSPTDPGERVEGTWGYYETLSHYVRSGAYDREPATPGLQPELEAGTYNGDVWELARGLFLPGGTGDPTSPEYDDALAYYRDRAAGPSFLWTWAGRPDDLDRYRDLIGDADGAARLRSTALGLVLANHLVSAVDALVVARLRSGAGVRLESRLVATRGTPRWNVGLRIPVPD